ncbi:MAG TPA: endolytic transglycosylase MltG [Gemmatimonadaceae bacterium]|nr:endolytic transglycosylase MltG [Gemmatimonadaceae bacterium]
MKRHYLAIASILVAFIVGCGHPAGAPVRVIVPKGASFKVATDSLSHAGIVRFPLAFRILARLKHEDRNIKPGTYLLKHGTPWLDVLTALNGGHGLVNSVTIPEGFALQQIIPLLAKTLRVPVDSVQAAVADTALLARLDIPTKTLEGYLFPDTYAFPDGTTARQAVSEMVKRFEREWKPEWNAQLAALKLNRNDIVTLASIIEKEARRSEERPVISAVYHNRLEKNMLLQADPTVQYALGRHTPRVLFKDLEVESPYNTYKHPGLPPGPIASPGGPSLVAALFPAKVSYLYFVARADGHHEFRATLAQHDSARRDVRRDTTAPRPVPAKARPR